MKRFLCSTITLTLALTATVSAKTFSDVPASHWAYDTINTMSDKEIINGYSDGTFKPSGTITNAEFITLATNAYCDRFNISKPPKTEPWYKGAIDTAIANHLIDALQFRGTENEPILRKDMALIIVNALENHSGTAHTHNDMPLDDAKARIQASFTDSATILTEAAQYQQAIGRASERSIISGDTQKRFNPNATATRAEAATIINNYLNATINTAPAEPEPEKPAPTDGKYYVGDVLYDPSLLETYGNKQVTSTEQAGKFWESLLSKSQVKIYTQPSTTNSSYTDFLGADFDFALVPLPHDWNWNLYMEVRTMGGGYTARINETSIASAGTSTQQVSNGHFTGAFTAKERNRLEEFKGFPNFDPNDAVFAEYAKAADAQHNRLRSIRIYAEFEGSAGTVFEVNYNHHTGKANAYYFANRIGVADDRVSLNHLLPSLFPNIDFK